MAGVSSEPGVVERRFMREAMRAPLLDVADEQSLARRWREYPPTSAADRPRADASAG